MKDESLARTHRQWLPEAALEGVVDRLLAEAIRHWSTKWFARSNARPLGPVGLLSPIAADLVDAEWMVLADDLAIAFPHSSRPALTSMMLNMSAAPEAMTDADQQIVTDLSAACEDDLCRRIAQTFRLSGEPRWIKLDSGTLPKIVEPRGCDIGIDARVPLLRIAASIDLLVGLIKSGLPIQTAQGGLQPVTAGLALQPITVSASLGHCALTLSDVAELNVGDVLVFDQNAGSPLSLVVDNSSVPIGQCSVEQEGDHLLLKVLESNYR